MIVCYISLKTSPNLLVFNYLEVFNRFLELKEPLEREVKRLHVQLP